MSQQRNRTVTLSVENVGGIEQSSQRFEPGITLLSGRNATNRTSFLQAIMAGLGSENVSLRAGADEGHVELTVDGETYTRTLSRTDDRGVVSFSGEPYTTDVEAADLFAFLLGDNEVRQHVRRGDVDLREIVMRPVDTASLNDRIETLAEEIADLERESREIDERRAELPSLRQRRTELNEELADVEERIDEKESEVEAIEVDIQESRDQKAAFDDAMGELNAARDRRNQAQDELAAEKRSLQTLRAEREETAEELAALDGSDMDEAELKDRRNQLVNRRETLQDEIEQLAEVSSFNRDLLNDDRPGITDELRSERGADDSEALTSQLVDGESTVCWTCGQSVEETRIEQTLDALGSYRQEKIDERSDIDSEISDIEDDLRTLRRERSRRDALEDELADLDTRIETTERNIDSISTRIETLDDEVSDLESTVEQLDVSDKHDTLVRLNDELNELKRERDDLRRRLNPIEDDIEVAKEAEDRRAAIEDELAEKRETLRGLRTRIDTLESTAVETFNQNMSDILDILRYDNIARVWIERRQVSVTEGRRTEEQSVFDLNVVRDQTDGGVFTDRVEHLSESEREVVGLVAALAGYLTHDVYETVPFVLLDSLESIDSERIADVIEYFSEFADYTIAALLPEDTAPADELDGTETVITDV